MTILVAVLAFNAALYSFPLPEYAEEFPISDTLAYEVTTGFEAWDIMGFTVSTGSPIIFTVHGPPFEHHTDYRFDVYLDHWGFRFGIDWNFRAGYDEQIWDARQSQSSLYFRFDSRLADWW